MNYEANKPQQEKSSAFNSIEQRLASRIDEQTKIIYEIADKLHAILNKRSPDNVKEPATEKAPDMYSRFQEKLDRMDLNNERLSHILDHLNDIISI